MEDKKNVKYIYFELNNGTGFSFKENTIFEFALIVHDKKIITHVLSDSFNGSMYLASIYEMNYLPEEINANNIIKVFDKNKELSVQEGIKYLNEFDFKYSSIDKIGVVHEDGTVKVFLISKYMYN